MKSIVLNTIAIFGGLIVGSAVNMGLISLGGELIPSPTSVDAASMEALAEAMHLFEPKHFLFPFLAHSLGTLAGAMFAAKIAATHKLISAMIIGLAFLVGGTIMVFSLPSPLWFNALDLIGAYIPMAYIGYKLVKVDFHQPSQ